VQIQQVHEPIAVVAVFAGGRIDPKRFRWGRRTCPIEAINGRWTDRDEQNYRLHYSVQSGSETYFLHFSSAEVQWWLDKIITQ
jgi:hypothetical protein